MDVHLKLGCVSLLFLSTVKKSCVNELTISEYPFCCCDGDSGSGIQNISAVRPNSRIWKVTTYVSMCCFINHDFLLLFILSDSCIPILLKDCKQGTILIDPCRCTGYYECVAGYEVLGRPCSKGTLFNYKERRCDDKGYVVVHGICSIDEPWNQCNETAGTKFPEVIQRCGGTPLSTQSPTSTPSSGQPGDQSGSNAGLIAGLVVGFLLVIILVILFIWYFKRKQLQNEKSGKFENRNPSVMNPGYASHDDDYARVDEIFTSPIYTTDTISSPPELPNRPPTQQGDDYQNGKVITDDGYVEPNDTLKTESTYTEVIRDEDHPAEDQIPSVTPPTPYDNSYT